MRTRGGVSEKGLRRGLREPSRSGVFFDLGHFSRRRWKTSSVVSTVERVKNGRYYQRYRRSDPRGGGLLVRTWGPVCTEWDVGIRRTFLFRHQNEKRILGGHWSLPGVRSQG